MSRARAYLQSAPLGLVAEVIGKHKSEACRVRKGDGGAEDSRVRYEALVQLADWLTARVAGDPTAICGACPREDCEGCRIHELV